MNRFKECREKARLSQKYVALTLGIKAPSVCDWEKGRTVPSSDNLSKLAELYNVSIDYLLGVDLNDDLPNDPTAPIRQEAHDLLDKLSDENYQAMLIILKGMTEKKG